MNHPASWIAFAIALTTIIVALTIVNHHQPQPTASPIPFVGTPICPPGHTAILSQGNLTCLASSPLTNSGQ